VNRVTAIALLATPAINPPAVGAQPHRPCAQRSTIAGYERWIADHQRRGRIPQRAKRRMWTLERCQAHGQPARLAGIRWRIHYLRSITYALTHPLLSALASWYDDAGQTASGYHAGLGVANKELAFGTRVQFDYHGHEVIAVVDDRGPYVGGRTWDLNQTTAGALGFDGVDVVRYRVLP
jgi:rare lipoprotein A (peptidoglycan hydrolase)